MARVAEFPISRDGTAIPGGGYGGAPTIADFDGDGKPEIGVAGASRYVVFETDGTVKWQTVVQDSSSNRTGSSVFDFDRDGAAEVVYGDELYLWVLDGSNGSLRFKTPKSSCTWYEYPLVADVDADGHAEILGVANNNCGFGSQRGVYLWGDNANWVDTRDVWNEHTYHITNVLQDGTIPTDEQPNWQVVGLNAFRPGRIGKGLCIDVLLPQLLCAMIADVLRTCPEANEVGVRSSYMDDP